MRTFAGTLLVLSMTAAGSALAQDAVAQDKAAQDQGGAVVGTQKGIKMAQDQCQAVWAKANPAKKPKISAGQANPFIADVKAANTNSDGAIDQSEFMAACDKGLMKDPATANTGSSAGQEGAGAPPAAAPPAPAGP